MTEADSISNDDSIGGFGKYAIAMVVVEGRPKMKSVHGMEVPGSSDGRFVVNEDSAASRANGHCIKVECTKEHMSG